MMVVAIISILSAGAYVVMKNVREDSRRVKLEQDVTTINNSIRLYSISGGSFDGVTTATGMIAKLKTVATNGGQLASLRGSMVDQRLDVVLAQPDDPPPFAVWDTVKHHFTITDDSTDAIKEFTYSESAIPSSQSTETRKPMIALNPESGWVWTYTNTMRSPKPAPTNRPSVVVNAPTPTTPETTQLTPPVFTPPPPQLVLLSYPLQVMIGPPSTDQWTTVYKKNTETSFTPYAGPITVDPGDTLVAKRISLEPETFTDSIPAVASYIPNPEPLVLGSTFPSSVSYGELGGPLITGSPLPVAPGTVDLATAAAIPLAYQNSSVFDIYWTVDASDPMVSGSRRAGSSFTNGYPGSYIPVTIQDFQSAPSITVNLAAASAKPQIVTSSPVYSKTISVEKSTLQAPIISPASGVVAVDATVTLSLNSSTGVLPAGVRIFYRTDGADPGDNGGEPVAGSVEWTGSTFTVTPTLTTPVTVTCRAYPPSGLNSWFTTSPLASATYSCAPQADPPTFTPPPPITDIALYPISVIINNPNDATYTQIKYTLSSAPATSLTYSGPIVTPPGTTINAYIHSIDLLQYRDSEHEIASYQPNPTTLLLADNFPGGYSYTQLGGAMAPGSPAVVPATPGQITLANASSIPDAYENNSTFRVYWTLDGTDPLSSGSRIQGAAFTNGYPGDNVPVTLANFGSASSLVVKYVADAAASASYLVDSVVTSTTLNISKITLPQPIFTPASGGDPSGGVTLALDIPSGLIPAGARIYYRTDGVDPGNTAGEPNAGATLWDGTPITILATQNVKARCYAPIGYMNWFDPSAVASATFTMAITTDCYASNGTNTIFRFDPNTGGVAIQTTTALFPIATVAYDSATGTIYYTEDTSTNFRLGKYDIATDVHTLLGSLTTPSSGTWNYTPSSRLLGMTYFAGNLYYVANGTDDLVRIDLSGAVVSNQEKIADITNGTKNFGIMGDITTTADGRLWIAGESELATFDLTTLSGYTSIRALPNTPGTPYYAALTRLPSDALYINRSGIATIYRLNAAGAETTSVPATPSTTFNDTAGVEAPITLPSPSADFFAVTGGNKNIYRLDPTTGLHRLINSTAPFNIGAIAYDAAAGAIYYLEDSSSSTWRIGKFLVASNTHATSLGDLKTIGANRPSIYPGNLVFYNNSLYYIHPSSQNLVQVGLNAGATAVSTQVNRALGTAMNTIGDLALDNSGVLYWVNTNGSTHTLWQFELVNDSFLSNLGTASRAYPALGVMNDVLFGAGGNGAANDSIDTENTPGTSTQVSMSQPNLTFTDFAAASTVPPPSPAGLFYGVSTGSQRIFKLDPNTGRYTREPVACSFVPAAVAYDQVNNLVYYVEKATSNWRIGRYNPTTGVHTTLTNHLGNTAAGWTPATSQPNHLIFFGGQLLFIDNNTDNLRRIEIDGNAIGMVGPFAKLNGGASQGAVNAATVATDGTLYFASPTLFAKYNLLTKSSYSVISSSPPINWQALVYAQNSLLYGVDTAQNTKSKVVDPLTGTGAITATYTSNRVFHDIAGTAPPVPPDPTAPGDLIAVADTKLSLFRANPDTGDVTSITDLAKFQPYAAAYDASTQIIYYTGGSVAGEFKLARYVVSSGQHFVMGDLRLAATYAYTPNTRAQNLVYFQDGLYYIAHDTDDLVKITVSGNTISAQVKVKDLSNNVSTWQAGGLSVNNLGLAYFGEMATDFYGKFMMPDGSAFSTVSTAAPRTYQGLAIRSSDQAMYATRPASVVGDLGKKFSSVNKTTGALTFVSNSTESNAIIDLSDAITLTGVVPNLYAVGGNNTSIYKFDGGNGNNIDWVSNAPFTIETVAVTTDETRIYYIEQTSSNWRLGEYAPATNTHTIRATLNDVAYAYQASSQPRNLMYLNGRLYYIAEGTDDLIAIEFADSGTPIVKTQSKVADLNNNVALTNVGDIASDTTGTLFISASNAFATWNYQTQSSFTIKTASPATYWTGLAATAAGNLLGVSNAEPGKLYEVNRTTGAGTFIANFTPTVSFFDFAAPQPNVSIDTTGLTYFISSSGTSIYRADIATGKESLITSQVPLTPSAIAMDHVNGLIYTAGDDIASTGDIQLSVFNLATGSNTLLGSLKAGGLAYAPTAAAHNLAYQNGFLYYVAKNTDDLVKVTVTASSITAASKVWDIGVPSHDWDTLAIGPDSSAYLSTRDTDYLARINLQLLTGPQVLKTSKGSDEGADYAALTFDASGQMIGALQHVNTKGYRVNTFNGATTYLWDGSYNGGAGLAISDFTSPYSDAPITSGSQFATDGGTNIFRVSPTTGTVTTLTTTASFNLNSLAYDAAAQVIYYTENATPNWRLAKYDIATDTHTILGNLDEPSVVGAWSYNPSTRPSNLSLFDGKLYYVHSNTDDLVRIDLVGNAIANQTHVADLTNGASNLGYIGDITTTSAGLLWIASENELATFNLTTLSGYTSKRTTTSASPGLEAYYPGLQRDLWNTIYADRQGVDTKIYQLDTAGAETTNVATNPPKGFIDYAGEENAPALPTATSVFYAINGGTNIYQLNPVTGIHNILNRAAPYNMGALAYDAVSNSLFYLEEGASATWRVGRYNITAGIHTPTLGDLKQVGSTRPSNFPGNLVYYNQALYYIHPGTSNLVKVQLNGTLDTVIEQTAISLGTSFVSIGDLALNDSGLLYFVNTIASVPTLYRYNLQTGSGLTAMGVAPRNYPGLGFLSGTLYGTGANGAIIESINPSTAASTVVATAQPNISFIDFASGQSAAAQMTTNFFATTNGSANIYRLDPTTGTNVLLNGAAPYNLGALAYDATRNYLYYLQDTLLSNDTWSLGRLDVTSGVHTTVGDIKPVTNTFSPTMVPRNLAYYNGALYFVVPGRDNLVKVQLDASGVAITGITQVASLTGGAVTFADPGDISATDAGMLLFSNTPAVGTPSLYRYDVVGATGFGVVGTLPHAEPALGLYQSNVYAAGTLQVEQLSQVNASLISSVASTPALAFSDFAGPSANTPPAASDDLWAIAGYASAPDPHLLRFRNYKNSGGNVDRTDFGALAYQDGTATTTFTSASVLAAMTVDASNRLYFVNSAPTVIAGVTYERPLFTINLSSLPSSGPVVASFVGDLGPSLRTAIGITPLTSNEVISGLAPAPDGYLRLVVRIGNGTTADAMCRITSLSPSSTGQLTVAFTGTLQNGATNAGNVQGLAIDNTGQAYVSDADDLGVYKVNATTGALTVAMHSTETTAGPLALHLSDTDIVTALSNSTITKVVTGNTNDAAYFNYFNLWGLNTPSAISFVGLSVTPPPAVTGYFAADGTFNIYRIDPTTGSNVSVTIAPFNVQSVGFDSAANKLYYVEAAASNWRIGRYDVTGNVHTIYNFTLTTPGGTNHTPITAQPENLFVANGGIYTIAPDTDDLIKIDLTPIGIDSIHKVADLNGDTTQGAVTAATIDANGMLYFASTAKLARYDLSVMGGYTVIANNPNIPWSSLVFNSSNFLFGVRSDDPYKTFSIDIATGTPTYVAPVLPKVAFTDMSSASGPYLPGSGYAFTSITNCPAILRTDLPTARVYFLTWQAKGDVEALAFDQANALVYYTVTTDSPQRLYAYDLRTDTHNSVRDALFQTDLKLIGTHQPTGTRAHNLTHFNGALYYIATGTDDLFKITFTSPYVIADQVRVGDIAGNATVGSTVGAFTVDDLGQAYISYEDANVLARFDMRTVGGYTVIDSSAMNPRYYALTYDSSKLNGIPFDPAVSQKLYTMNVTTGARTLVADVNPTNQIIDLATSTPNQPALPAPTANFFAITGGNSNLYRLDPTTGVSALLNNSAPYNLGAIAYDGVSGNIFYLQDGADATWNVGKYTVGTSTHSATLGNIKTIATAATAYPGNLVYYNSALYYIQPGTNNIVKSQLDAGATTITGQTTISLGTTFNTVGDLALDDSGVLYWVSANGGVNTFYKYNLRDATGFANIGSTTKSYPSLGFLTGKLYGTGGNAFVIESLNLSSGVASVTANTQPQLTFTDFASASSASVPAPPAWAIGENTNAQLLKINGYDGSPTLTNYGDIRYPGSGGVATALAVDSDIESFAVTTDNYAYFVRNKDTNINGVVYGRPLFRIDLNTVTVGSVAATFLGDLDQALSAMNGATITTSTNVEAVSGLAVGADGSLYAVYQRGTDTAADKLFKITGLSVDGANNLTGWSAVGDLTNGTNVGTNVDALEFHPNGTLYAFDSKDGEMLVINPATAVVTSLHSTEASIVSKDLAINPTNNDFISINGTGKSLQRVVASGSDTTLWSYNSAPPWGTPTFTDLPGFKFPARNFNPVPTPPAGLVYAVTGGNKDIYSLNLTTGATVKVVDNAAAFNVSSLAYDPVQNTIFYLQDTATGYSLGSWQIATNVHNSVYNLTTGNNYNSTVKPTNLAWWGGYLYFIEPGTDDLVRITTSPTIGTEQTKVRDLTANTVAFSSVGDLAVDDTGLMYFSAIASGNSIMAKFNLSSMSSYVEISSITGTADYCESIVFGPDAGSGRPLFVARDASRTVIRTLNTTTGVISGTSTATTPSLALLDTSDLHLNAASYAGAYYAVAGGTDRNIYQVNPETGTSSTLSTAAVAFAGLSAIAWDQTNGYLYYIEEAASNFKLGRYSLDTNSHISLGSLQGSFTYSPASKPGNLAFMRGGLYYIATGTDDLVRIDVSSTSIVNQVQIANLNGNTSLVNVGDLTCGTAYLAYFTAGGKLYSFNVQTLAAATVVSTFTQGTPDALSISASGSEFYGVFNPAVGPTLTTQIHKISLTGSLSTNVSTGALAFRDLAGPDLSRPDDVSTGFYIGGDFGASATTHRGIARLSTTTGAVDPSYQTGAGNNTGTEVKAILPVGNGQVLGGGTFSTFEGQPRTGIVRLNPDGSVDTTFAPVFK
jgi:hypothetical protein